MAAAPFNSIRVSERRRRGMEDGRMGRTKDPFQSIFSPPSPSFTSDLDMQQRKKERRGTKEIKGMNRAQEFVCQCRSLALMHSLRHSIHSN